MFVSNAPVSTAAMERAARFRRSHPSAAATDVPPPLHFNEDERAAALPPLTLMATPEEVRQAYPDPPAELLRHSEDNSNTRSTVRAEAPPAARKRVRPELTPLQSPQTSHAAEHGATTGPTMHFRATAERVNYLGRAFLEPPPALEQRAAALLAKPCQPPRVLRGVFADKHTAGVQQLRWAPPTHGHLLFSGDLHGEAYLWNLHEGQREPFATYHAHTQPIKSLEVTTDARVMSSGSMDGTVAMWDVEAGQSTAVLTNPEQLPVAQHVHHPSNEQALLLAAVGKKVVLYDVRSSCSRCVREYTGHMGSIFNLTLLSEGTKMLTTAEDKTLRTWDFRIPIQIKQFADAGMHAISHVVRHPSSEYLAAQSLDNKIIVFKDEGAGKLRRTSHREFIGHNITGTRCQLAFSHDGRYISSGDIDGSLFVWQWATGELVKSFKAHSQMLVSHLWHPLEPSRVVTAAWDSRIKLWS